MSKPSGGTVLKIGGAERHLQFGVRAYMRVDEILGEGVAANGNIGFRACVVLVWAGLLHANPKLSLTKVIDWFEKELDKDPDFFGKAIVVAMEAYSGRFRQNDDEEDEEEGNEQEAQSSQETIDS